MSQSGGCVFITAHNRLREAHIFWHEALTAYQEPELFRTKLNAVIQSLRNITWALQNEKNKCSGFDDWYQIWQDRMRDNAKLKWAHTARTIIVKQKDLEAYSIAEARVLLWTDVPLLRLKISPFISAEQLLLDLVRLHVINIPESEREDTVLELERRWVVDEFPNAELLDILAEIYIFLENILIDAHKMCGVYYPCDMVISKCSDEELKIIDGRLSCMVATREKRTARLHLGKQRFVNFKQRQIALDEGGIEKMRKRYGVGENFKPRTPSKAKIGPLDYVINLVEQAKIVLQKDKGHTGILFLFSGNEAILIEGLLMEDPGDQNVIMRQISEDVKKTGADGLILIFETWVVEHNKLLEEGARRVRYSKHKREQLLLHAETSDGKTKTCIIPFERTLFGRIKFGEIHITDSYNVLILEPVREIWRRRSL